MKRPTRVIAALATLATTGALIVASSGSPALAVDGSQWDPGYIVSDQQFYDGSAMTQAQIQAFLEAKVPVCHPEWDAYPDDVVCLKDYRQDTVTLSADAYCPGTYVGASNETASTIIAKVSAACNINAKVILITLQKEQSLVTHVWPSSSRYAKATGYACPDSAPCNPEYAGFQKQVYYAARQFQRYHAGLVANYRPGINNVIKYNPDSACGSRTVFIQNAATAGLYIYTPYVPNAAALSNLYGTGDGCSSYGNRNFWRIWWDWFGDPTATVTVASVSPASGSTDGWTSVTLTGNHFTGATGVTFGGVAGAGLVVVSDTKITVRTPARAVGSVDVAVKTPLGSSTVQTFTFVAPISPPAPPDPASISAVYRFWSPNNKAHFYTNSVAERDLILRTYPSSEWTYEGGNYNAFSSPQPGTVPLYRFWSAKFKGHFFTTSEAEKDQVIANYDDATWLFEGIAYYVYPVDPAYVDTVTVARFWSQDNKHHFYTASAAERDQVIAIYPDHQWAYEQDAFRVPSSAVVAAPLP